MGAQPPLLALPVPHRQTDSRLPKPQSSPAKVVSRSRARRLEEPVALPAEAQQLKDKILENCPNKKLSRFSLSHMRRVVVPPVRIPDNLNGPRVLSTVVAGRNIPYTRRMWENRKKKTFHLDMVDEYVQLYR